MAKYTGVGGAFRIGKDTAGTVTYTDVAQVSSVGSISISSDEVEVTTLDNLSGFREFLQTFKDAGELPIGLVWDPALPTHGETATGLWGLMVSGEVVPMEIEFPIKPTPYVAHFSGFVKTFPTPSLTPDDALTAEVSIRVSGTVTLEVKAAPLADGTLVNDRGAAVPGAVREGVVREGEVRAA
jgi:hypothetical protein